MLSKPVVHEAWAFLNDSFISSKVISATSLSLAAASVLASCNKMMLDRQAYGDCERRLFRDLKALGNGSDHVKDEVHIRDLSVWLQELSESSSLVNENPP
jgi:hypothetical protein